MQTYNKHCYGFIITHCKGKIVPVALKIYQLATTVSLYYTYVVVKRLATVPQQHKRINCKVAVFGRHTGCYPHITADMMLHTAHLA